MPTFSLHARRAIEAAKNAKLIAQLVREDGVETTFERPKRGFEFPEPTDLRGIPAIGRNVGGAIPGTRPDAITGRD